MGMGGLSILALQFKRKSRTKCPNKIVSLDYNYDFFDDALLFYFWRFDVFFTLKRQVQEKHYLLFSYYFVTRIFITFIYFNYFRKKVVVLLFVIIVLSVIISVVFCLVHFVYFKYFLFAIRYLLDV